MINKAACTQWSGNAFCFFWCSNAPDARAEEWYQPWTLWDCNANNIRNHIGNPTLCKCDHCCNKYRGIGTLEQSCPNASNRHMKWDLNQIHRIHSGWPTHAAHLTGEHSTLPLEIRLHNKNAMNMNRWGYTQIWDPVQMAWWEPMRIHTDSDFSFF